MSILNVNKINPVGGGSTITIAGIASVTGSVTATGTITGEHHGDGSNLTGITGTTINNNADNRIITGSGTANRLEGESNLTFNGTNLLTVHVPSATGEPAINFTNSDTGTGTSNGFGLGISGSESPFIYNRENTDLRIGTNNIERLRINAAGNVGINQTSPSDKLHVNGTTNFTGNSYIGGDLYMYGSSYTKGIFIGGSGSSNKLDDYEEGSFTPTTSGISATHNPNGRYVKIGNHVFVSMVFTRSGSANFTFSGGDSGVVLTNLPFACGDFGGVGQIVFPRLANTGSSDGQGATVFVEPGQAKAYVSNAGFSSPRANITVFYSVNG